MASPVGELLVELEELLRAAGFRWYLFGAQAALLHGAARLTADVDVTVDIGTHAVTELVATLEDGGFKSRVADLETFAEQRRVLPLVHETSGIAVDVVLAGSAIEELFFEHVQHRIVEGTRVPVASAEDVIVMKVLAGRGKDLDDVIAILAAQADTLDLARVRETLGQLEAALDRSDLLPELDKALAASRS